MTAVPLAALMVTVRVTILIFHACRIATANKCKLRLPTSHDLLPFTGQAANSGKPGTMFAGDFTALRYACFFVIVRTSRHLLRCTPLPEEAIRRQKPMPPCLKLCCQQLPRRLRMGWSRATNTNAENRPSAGSPRADRLTGQTLTLA